MLATAAAVIFALALLADWTNVDLGSALTPTTLVTLGLLCLALHLAGVGATRRRWTRRR